MMFTTQNLTGKYYRMYCSEKKNELRSMFSDYSEIRLEISNRKIF